MMADSFLSPTHTQVLSHLRDLLILIPPSFIYITDPTNARLLSTSLALLLSNLSEEDEDIRCVQTNAISCLNHRIFYDSVLNGLARWKPRWDSDGCRNWGGGPNEVEFGTEAAAGDMRWNEDLTGFLHGLKAVERHTMQRKRDKRKGKQKDDDDEEEMVKLVIVVDNAERLDADLLVPLTRLDELSQTNTTVIFTSAAGWQDVRLDFGDAKDPYYMDVDPPTRTLAVEHLKSAYARLSKASPSTHPESLAKLYLHFAQMLVDTCITHTNDILQLEYIAAATWPQLISDLREILSRQREAMDLDEEEDSSPQNLQPPNEATRMVLMKKLSPLLKIAIEDLIPRHTSASAWLATSNTPSASHREGPTALRLPLISKFILIAAFLASTNPPKSDFKMFGRTKDGVMGSGKKRKGGGTRKTGLRTKEGHKLPIPQRLLGPTTFSLDRLMAILGALLYEYWPYHDQSDDEDEDGAVVTDTVFIRDGEQRRVNVYQSICSLASSHMLTRISPAERLDDPSVTFKLGKGVGYEMILEMARDKDIQGFRLSEFMWENWG